MIMSLYGLQKQFEYYRDVDQQLDDYSAAQTKRRAVILPEAELQVEATELHGKILNTMMKHARNGWSNVPLKTHPECVINRVIAMLAEKGIKAKHSYNEHTPKYDHLGIDLSTVKVG
jgi:hypothetical protein